MYKLMQTDERVQRFEVVQIRSRSDSYVESVHHVPGWANKWSLSFRQPYSSARQCKSRYF